MYELCDELQSAVIRGSVERTVALLAGGDIDIDERRPKGWTALMLGASTGDVGVVRILVNKGANLSLVDDRGFSALHLATQGGHVAVTKLLMEAGADPEAQVSATDPTPLYAAAEQGHSEVVGVLIEAGADPNTRGSGGLTPLYIAAGTGRVTAIKVLLRAKANPLLGCDDDTTPLDVAAQNGHLEVVDTLIQECGIEGCGGASGGVTALQHACPDVEMMGLLTSAGVVDTGAVLINAAMFSDESSVKFLLQRQAWDSNGQGAGYLDTIGRLGETPLACSIQACSPRITRLLVDAGADTSTPLQLTDEEDEVYFTGTPLALVDVTISETKEDEETDATEGELHSLEATRRLLLRVEAVQAVSWLWTRHTEKVTSGTTMTTPTPLVSILPVLRRRASRPRVLLAALFRNSTKP